MSFENWIEDVQALATWLEGLSPDAPLILHGLELGALLAGKAFETGRGDGLLLWAAPASANQALRATLLRRIAMDHAFKYGEDRKPASEYFGKLESGQFLEVEGYKWSGRLWHDSFQIELPAGLDHQACDASDSRRPVRSIQLSKNAAPLVRGSSDAYEAINKDFNGLFADSFAWIAASLATVQGGRSERSH